MQVWLVEAREESTRRVEVREESTRCVEACEEVCRLVEARGAREALTQNLWVAREGAWRLW